MVGENKAKKKMFVLIFLFPSLFGIVMFYIFPMAHAVFLSLTDYDTMTVPKFIGMNNYLRVFTQDFSVLAIVNTFKFIVGYIPLVICLGLIAAVLLNSSIKGIKIYRALFFIPVITSWVAVSIIWRWLLNGHGGLVNYLLSIVGIAGPLWLNDYFWSMPAIILTSVWKDIGFVATILLSGLQSIDSEYYESAVMDGACSITKFFKITVPLLSPTMYFILIISLINSFQLFDQVLVMTNGGPAGSTTTIVHQVYSNAFLNYKMGFASAQSIVLFCIILLFTLVQNILQKRWVTYETK